MNNTTCIVIVAALLSIVAVILGGIAADLYRDCRFIEAGYNRQAIPGSHYLQWVKGNPSDCDRAAPVPGLDPRNWIVSEPVPLSSAAGGSR